MKISLRGCACDIVRLEALGRVPDLSVLRDLYRGPLCDSLTGPTEAFEDYIWPHRLRLSEHALALGLDLLERTVSDGREGNL